MKIIPLRGGGAAVIDDCDYDAVAGQPWRLVRSGTCKYAAYGKRIAGKFHMIFMHRPGS